MDRRGWIVAGALAAGLAAPARAQEALPMEATPGPGPAEAPDPGCSPGRCSHRTFFSRRRCKRHLQEVFVGYPEEFERPPLGAAVYAASKAQVGNGEAARMVFSARDFQPEADALAPSGVDRLASVRALLRINFAPIVVEETGDPALDASRRAAVLARLNQQTDFGVPAQRVVIGPKIALGMSANEVEIVRQTRLSRTASRGPALNATGTDPGGQSPTLPQLEQGGLPNDAYGARAGPTAGAPSADPAPR